MAGILERIDPSGASGLKARCSVEILRDVDLLNSEGLSLMLKFDTRVRLGVYCRDCKYILPHNKITIFKQIVDKLQSRSRINNISSSIDIAVYI